MGKALIIQDCDFSSVKVKKIHLKGVEPTEPITNNITFSTTSTSIKVDFDYPTTSELTINFSGIGSLIIPIGSSHEELSFESSNEYRVVSISVSPISDHTYTYTAPQSITIPASTEVPLNLAIVGDRNAFGSDSASVYTLIDRDTMRRVTNDPSKVSELDEYIDGIEWHANGSGTISQDGRLTINGDGFTDVYVTVGNKEVASPLRVQCHYSPADYLIKSFSDLEKIEYAVNNGTESSLQLEKLTEKTIANNSGFSDIVFRFTNDIDCEGSHVEIGIKGSNGEKAFKGTIDGSYYTMYNVGGNCGVEGRFETGGEVASILVRYGSNCEIRNLKVEGEVVNIASRGYGGLLALYEGTCYVKRVFVDVNTTQNTTIHPSGCCLIAGWSANSGTVEIEDSTFDGDFVSLYSLSGMVSSNGSLLRCATYGNLSVGIEKRSSTTLSILAATGDSVTSSIASSKLNVYRVQDYPGLISVNVVQDAACEYCYEYCDWSNINGNDCVKSSNFLGGEASIVSSCFSKEFFASTIEDVNEAYELNEDFFVNYGYQPCIFNSWIKENAIINKIREID